MGVTIRPTVSSDIALLYRIWNDHRVLLTQYEPNPHLTHSRYELAMAAPEGLDGSCFCSRTVLLEHELIGHVMLNWLPSPSGVASRCELSWNLDPDYWGRGLMTDAVRSVVRELLSESPEARITVSTDPRNDRCIGLLRKCGCVPIALSDEDRQRHFFDSSSTRSVRQYAYVATPGVTGNLGVAPE